MRRMNMYVDVRGPHPILFDGMNATELRGLTRAITVEEALQLLRDFLIENKCPYHSGE